MESLYVHGFGWSSHLFSDQRHVYDRGYFGHPIPFPPTHCSEILCHSAGLHWIPQPLLQRAKRVVVVGGFLSLGARVLDKMLRRSHTHFEEMMRQFYQNCGLEQEMPIVDRNLLIRDLEGLKQEWSLAFVPDPHQRWHVIHGTEDRIAPLKCGERLAEHLKSCGARVAFTKVEGGSHMSPLFTIDLFRNGVSREI